MAQRALVSESGDESQMVKLPIWGPKSLPLMRKNAINVHVSVPCPLKVRLKMELDAFISGYNLQHDVPIYCPTLHEGSPHSVEDVMLDATHADEVPDVWLTNSSHTLFAQPFKQRFIDSGIYEGVTPPAFLACLPPVFQQMTQEHNIGFLAFGAWGIVMDTSVEANPICPQSWSDLVKPEFKGKIGIHGCSGHVSGTNLLMVLRERLGAQAIPQFASNIGAIKHFSQIIKAMDSGAADRALFNIMPCAAIRQIPSRKKVVELDLNDGPILTPTMLMVKRGKLAEYQEIIDFFCSEPFRALLAKGDLFMPDAMDWDKPYTLPDFSVIARQDFNALCEELDALFQDGLAIELRQAHG